MQATFAAVAQTYGFLTPDLWTPTYFSKAPYQEYTDFLAKEQKAPTKPVDDDRY